MLCDEFDPERKAVINPEDCLEPIPGFPEICIGIFSDQIFNAIVEKYHGRPIDELRTCSGNSTVYEVCADGVKAALMLPFVGGPNAISCIEEIFPRGGKYFVFAGCCGVLRHDIADGHLIIPTAAVRDEGTSYHYQPPAEEIVLDSGCVEAARQAMEALGLPYAEGKTWTTDALYRETRGKVEKRKAQGCICVEMECASLAAAAKFRNVDFAQFFWAADNLDAPEWEKRGLSQRGSPIGDMVFAAALETGRRLKKRKEE